MAQNQPAPAAAPQLPPHVEAALKQHCDDVEAAGAPAGTARGLGGGQAWKVVSAVLSMIGDPKFLAAVQALIQQFRGGGGSTPATP
jgi:hypothetical protein